MRILSLAVGVPLLLAVFAGCNLNTDYFGDYRGKNLLGNSDFGSGKWSLVSDPTLAAGGGYLPTDYMTWESIAAGGHLTDANAGTPTKGPDGVSPSYRLEIKNLIPDGDFEGEIHTPSNTTGSFVAGETSFWTTTGPTIAFQDSSDVTTYTNGVPPAIAGDHRSLVFNYPTAVGGATYLKLALDNAVNATSAGFWSRSGSYRFRLDFYNYSTGTTFDLSLTGPGITNANVPNVGNWTFSNLPAASSPTVVSASFLLINTPPALGPSWTVNFGGVANDQIIVDNVRLLNVSVDPSVMLSFSSLSSGTAQLLPGTKSGAYVFTVYVRDDPTADQTQAAGTVHLVNRFYASGLTISVRAAVKSGSGTYSTFVARPPGGWTSWSKITVSLGFDFVDSDSKLNGQPALAVELSPTNVSNVNVQSDGNSSVSADRDVGSLLIAQPALTFNP